jgi:hypothetical protein
MLHYMIHSTSVRVGTFTDREEWHGRPSGACALILTHIPGGGPIHAMERTVEAGEFVGRQQK